MINVEYFPLEHGVDEDLEEEERKSEGRRANGNVFQPRFEAEDDLKRFEHLRTRRSLRIRSSVDDHAIVKFLEES